MYGVSAFGTSPFGTASPIVLVELTSGAGATDSLALTPATRLLSDSATASEVLAYLLSAPLSDSAAASDQGRSYATLLQTLLDEATASEALVAALLGVTSDNADASDTLGTLYTQIGRLVDQALARDPLLSYAQVVNLLYTTAVASELLSPVHSAHLSDAATASETLVHLMQMVAVTVETALASSTLADSLRIIGTVSDEADASDALSSLANLLMALESGASASVILSIGGEQYTAWVLNTENIAVTQYTNYPFNSYCELNGKYYGAASDGLYLLEGSDDAGMPIQAYLRSPLTDFGFAGLKRLETPTLGYTSDGELVFKAIVVSPNGVKEEHWYRLEARPTGGTRENRVKIGKGLKSVYWQFERHNITGSDFAIETTRLWPMGLSRKVR